MEERIEELENSVTKLLAWAKAKTELIDKLEAEIETLKTPVSKPTAGVPQSWTQAEEDYLWEEARMSENLTDKLHALTNQWPKLFNKTRTYISLRKKFNRLKEARR
jgi:hypothetical protein